MDEDPFCYCDVIPNYPHKREECLAKVHPVPPITRPWYIRDKQQITNHLFHLEARAVKGLDTDADNVIWLLKLVNELYGAIPK